MNIEAIDHSISEKFSILDQEPVKKACRALRTRVEALIRAEGGYIEKSKQDV